MGELGGAALQFLRIVDHQRRLPDQFLPGVAEQALAGRVDREDDALGVGGDDAEGQTVEDRLAQGVHLRRLQQLRGVEALGDVDHRGQHEVAVSRLQGIEPDLDRHFRAVLPQAVEIAAGAHGARVRMGEEAVAVVRVTPTKALWNQDLDRLAQQLLAGVAEQLLDLRVDQHDPAVAVDHQHGVGCGFHHQAQALLRALALGDVDDGSQHEHALGQVQRVEADFDRHFRTVFLETV